MSDPLVTVVVPMRNEAASIRGCLEAILSSQLPMEILVLDGGSQDGSCEIVSEFADADVRVGLHDNPGRIQATAFNQALAMARGAVFARVDARTTISSDYLENAIEVLERTGAANVGGPILSQGTTPSGRAIATAYGSRFGLGHERHDPDQREYEVDSVSFGVWRTDALRAVGGMNPAFVVNEDYELNFRLRRAGYRIVWNPLVKSRYQVRGSLPKLARQYLRYGFWKARTILEHPASLRWRQTVAPAFVLSVLLTPLATWLLGPVMGTLHLFAYAAANIAASIITASRSGWQHLWRLPLIFAIIHLCWGTGFLAGWCWWPFHRDAA